jgi:hypothetical protein
MMEDVIIQIVNLSIVIPQLVLLKPRRRTRNEEAEDSS